jgi:hypothetical protein
MRIEIRWLRAKPTQLPIPCDNFVGQLDPSRQWWPPDVAILDAERRDE